MFSKTFTTATLLTLLTLPLLTSTQTQAADGLIVPFTSVLPACASLCGKLFDVQGACTPPAVSATSSACFCGDPRLTPFLNSGTAGVESVCGAASCQDVADLQKIQSWYESYCNVAQSNPTTTSSAGSTGTGTSTGSSTPKSTAATNTNQGWFATHWKWVVMLIIMVVGLTAIWVGAVLLRRRYLRKKEKEIEMRPPVAWGPHQMQGATGGYKYGDGVVDARGGAAKEARSQAVATPPPVHDQRGSKGLRKNRS